MELPKTAVLLLVVSRVGRKRECPFLYVQASRKETAWEQRKLVAVRTDNGTEYVNERFDGALTDWGIEHEHTNVKTPQQNGVSERLNRTIEEGVRSVLIDSKMPISMWPYAVRFVIYVRNWSSHSANNHQTPFELWNGKMPAFKHIRPFGTTAVAWNPNRTEKFEATGIECRLLGFSTKKKSCVLQECATGRIFESRDVRFMSLEENGIVDEGEDYSLIFESDAENQPSNTNQSTDTNNSIYLQQSEQQANNQTNTEEPTDQLVDDSGEGVPAELNEEQIPESGVRHAYFTD